MYRGRLFPNTETLGFYEPLAQTVHLNKYDSTTIDRAKASDNFLVAARDFLRLTAHEMTHWLDHTSTLWGQSLLVEMHNALNAWASDTEGEFWRVAALDNRFRREGLSLFYTKVDQPGLPPGNAATWRWKPTCGLEFGADGRMREDRPIAFVVFSRLDENRISRVPLSIVSLLETNAMWSEMKVNAEICGSVSGDARNSRWSAISAAYLRELYTADLTLYSAAAHMVATYAQTQEIGQTFRLTSALTNVILNLTSVTYGCLRIDDEIKREWGDRADALVSMCDPGFAFLCLSRCAPEVEERFNTGIWLNECCARAGLPSVEELRQDAAAAIASVPRYLTEGMFTERAMALLKAGRENFPRWGPLGPNHPYVGMFSKEGEYKLPPVVMSDNVLVRVAEQTVNDAQLDPHASDAIAHEYSSWAAEFLRACRP